MTDRPILKRKKVPIGSKPMSYYFFRNHHCILATTLRAASSSMHLTVSRRPTISQQDVLGLRDTVPVLVWHRDPLERLACAAAIFQECQTFAQFAENAINKYNAHWSPQTDVHTWKGVYLPTVVLPFEKLGETWPDLFPDHPLPHTKNFARKSWDELVQTITTPLLERILAHYEEDLKLYRKINMYVGNET